eukprot:1150319-Pelagomonas_calceolata.AAC.6
MRAQLRLEDLLDYARSALADSIGIAPACTIESAFAAAGEGSLIPPHPVPANQPQSWILTVNKKRKGNSTLAKRPRALRKGSLTSKLERVSPKGPQI